MKCDFVVGDEVVCVEIFIPQYDGECIPTKDVVYHIRDISIEPKTGDIFLRLQEIINTPQYTIDGFLEVCWFASAFRKVRKTNIEIFKAMLNKTPEQNKRELTNA